MEVIGREFISSVSWGYDKAKGQGLAKLVEGLCIVYHLYLKPESYPFLN